MRLNPGYEASLCVISFVSCLTFFFLVSLAFGSASASVREEGERLFLCLSLSLLTFTSAFHLFLSHTRARALSLCLCLARLFETVPTSLVVTTEHRHTVSGHKLLVHAALRGFKLLGYAVLSLLVSLSQRNTRHSSPTLIPAPEFNAHLQTAGVWVTGRVGVWVCG